MAKKPTPIFYGGPDWVDRWRLRDSFFTSCLWDQLLQFPWMVADQLTASHWTDIDSGSGQVDPALEFPPIPQSRLSFPMNTPCIYPL